MLCVGVGGGGGGGCGVCVCVCAATSWSYGKNCNIHEIMSILLAVLGYYSNKLI